MELVLGLEFLFMSVLSVRLFTCSFGAFIVDIGSWGNTTQRCLFSLCIFWGLLVYFRGKDNEKWKMLNCNHFQV